MLSPDLDLDALPRPVYALPAEESPRTGPRPMEISPAQPKPGPVLDTSAERRARRALLFEEEERKNAPADSAAETDKNKVVYKSSRHYVDLYSEGGLLPKDEQIEEFRRMKREQDESADADFFLHRAAARAAMMESIESTKRFSYAKDNGLLIIAIHLVSIEENRFSGYWMASRPASGRIMVRCGKEVAQIDLESGQPGAVGVIAPIQFALPNTSAVARSLFSIDEGDEFAFQWHIRPDMKRAVLPPGNENVRMVVVALTEDRNRAGAVPERMRAVVYKSQ